MSSESHLEFYRRWNRLARPYIEWQFDQFKPFIGRRVADLGCGLGNFTPFLLDRDLYLGIDTDEELLGELRKEHSNDSNVKTLSLDLTSPALEKELQKESIDTILCVNVIEHIEQDVLAIKNMIQSLPKDGCLCLLVPACPFLFGTLDLLDGHYRRYTRSTVQNVFANQPGYLEKLYYFNLAGVPGWWIKGRLLKQKTQTNDNYRIMNALIPIMRPVESWLHPPIGMSLIAVFRKTKNAFNS